MRGFVLCRCTALALTLVATGAAGITHAAEADFANTRARLEMAMEGPSRTPAEIHGKKTR
jgi:hypothetical protein